MYKNYFYTCVGEPPDDNGCLMPALEGIVIGHWSSDGKSHPQQRVNGSHTNVFPYKDLTDLKKQLIQVFSFDTQTVIDADATNGKDIVTIMPM